MDEKAKNIFVLFESIIFYIKRLYKFSLCVSLDFFISLAKIANFTNYLLSKENIYLMLAAAINLYLSRLLLEIHINLSLVSSKQILCVVSALSGIEEDDSLFWFCILQIRWSNTRTALSLVSDMV